MWIYLTDHEVWLNFSLVESIYVCDNGGLQVNIPQDEFYIKNKLDIAKIRYYLDSYESLYRDVKCSPT